MLDYKKTFLVVLAYIAGFFLIQYALHRLGVLAVFPDNKNLVQWDAAWYESIAQKGYVYWHEQPNNCGFYFLFPLVWKVTHFFPFAISLFNALFFAAGVALFSKVYPARIAEVLLWISTPSLFFMMVPYAEALFFLLATICCYGIVQKKRYLVWISLFLLSLTRANAVIFMPVFLLAELLVNDKKKWATSLITGVVDYCLPLIAGTIVFILYQYLETGVWFAYYKLQAEFWGRQFSLPSFPLTSMWGKKFLWLNALAMFIGFSSLLILGKTGWRWLQRNERQDKLLVISLLYFAGSFLLILFFNPKWGSGTTNVFGAHRYMLATPFLFILLREYVYNRNHRLTDYLAMLVLSNAFWMLFGSYASVENLLYFNISTFIILCYMLLNMKQLKALTWVIVAANILLQVWMFQSFIQSAAFPD